ncbi:unnamed protein product [Umbelopsis sp. WA50703]
MTSPVLMRSFSAPCSSDGKGSIYVSGADGEKGSHIVQQLLDLPQRHPHLPPYPVYAGMPNATTVNGQALQKKGAHLIQFDIFENPEWVVEALQGMAKLILVVDPLSDRITRNNAFHYAKTYIDAAKQANVSHIIFLTPFSPLDPSTSPNVTPPLTPPSSEGDKRRLSLSDASSYRSQFMMMESHLQLQFPASQITILRYPGILHQHLSFFAKHINTHNRFPLPSKQLQITVESCNMQDIARAVSFIAFSPTTRHSSNVYKLTGPQLLTLQELSERVSAGLGRDLPVDAMDMRSLKHVLGETMGSDDKVAFLLEMWGLQQRLEGRRFEVTRDLELLTGQSGKTIGEYFKEDSVKHIFTPGGAGPHPATQPPATTATVPSQPVA